MNNFEQSMQNIFGVEPSENTDVVPVVKKQVTPKKIEVDYDRDLTDAYNQSKDNIQELIDQGKDAMEEILEVARQSQHPRAFEVYGALLKNMVDANKELLNIQKQIREMDKETVESKTTNIDKAIFVGSTTELAKMLKDMKS